MKKIKICLILFIFSFMTPAFAQKIRGEQEAVKADSWIYDSLTAVMMDSGITHFYDHAPLTIQEIKIMLNEVEYEKLSEAGKKHYDMIESYFNESVWSFGSDDFFMGLDLSVNPEGQFKTNDDLDWIFSRNLRSKFIYGDLGIKISKYAALGADISLSQSKSAQERKDNYVNVPYSTANVDMNFPHDAYFITGFTFKDVNGINFKLATLNQNVGRSNMGSVIMSDKMTDAPFAELKVFSPYILYKANITMLGLDRYMYIHNIDLRPHKKITVSLFEGALPYGNLDLRYMIPFSIFHGYAGWWDYQHKNGDEMYDVGSYFGAKINYTPVKDLRLYTNFAMNQFQMPNEEDKSIPSGMAVQLGAESFIPLSKGFLHLNIEGSAATPYFMINESPNWSFLRSYGETCDNALSFYEWIGTPFGPDTVAVKFNAGYSVPKKWGVDFNYLFLARGELARPDFGGWGGYVTRFTPDQTSSWVYPKGNEKYKNGAARISPSGIAEYLNVFSIKGEYWPVEWLCINAYPGFAFAFNNKNVEGDIAVGFEMALSVKCFLTKIGK